MNDRSHTKNAGSIIYNVTIKVEASISAEWLNWMIDIHIPEVMLTGCFLEYKMARLLELDDRDGPTFAVQYSADSKADYNRYIENYSSRLRMKSFEKWGEKFIAFRTVMEVVK